MRIKPDSQLTPQKHTVQSYIQTSSTRLHVFGAVLFISAVIALPFTVRAGLLTSLFTSEVEIIIPAERVTQGPTEIALLSAENNHNPLNGRGGAELIIDDNALVSNGPIGEDEIAEVSSSLGEIRVYTVREGDSLSQIAEMFDVTTNTIMWANDLTRVTDIRPGDTLVILPIAGVRHIVKSGDTISSIASKYESDADEIVSYNQLESETDLVVGSTLIIPGGALHAAPVKSSTRSTGVASSPAESAGSGWLVHPAPGSVRTQGIHGYNAVDLAAGAGSPIRAAAAGEVIVAKSSGWNGGYGNYVVIRHSNGVQTLYSHLSSLNVGVGSYVNQGQVIGGMGSTGRSTGTHLHFEVRGARNPF